tara:strand:- start:15535 stop:15837 length:303 start_codon:yes stop_codon:yes gene_type:complete
MLVDEANQFNLESGKSFDVAQSVFKQLPFFACENVFLKKEYQDDISKHVYCKEYSVSPYSGNFGDQPKKWVAKSRLIKNAISKKESMEHQKAMNEIKHGK